MPAINAPRPALRRYREARDLIETGDLLLFRRPRGFFSAASRLISIAGRSVVAICETGLRQPPKAN